MRHIAYIALTLIAATEAFGQINTRPKLNHRIGDDPPPAYAYVSKEPLQILDEHSAYPTIPPNTPNNFNEGVITATEELHTELIKQLTLASLTWKSPPIRCKAQSGQWVSLEPFWLD
jgi:hypothetical protein